MYEYGLIGNCHVSALISKSCAIEWMCLPDPDSPPVFGRLLDPEGGHFAIEPVGEAKIHQYYVTHTNILVTHFVLTDGSEFRVIDFCPRFLQQEKMFRPLSLFRIVEPVRGETHIRVRVRPVEGWSKKPAAAVNTGTHLAWNLRDGTLSCSTNAPLTNIVEESELRLNMKLYFELSWNSVQTGNIQRTAEDYLLSSELYWQTWVKHCSIPTLFQEQTIRSALTLKLHCFEDTGAILAAITTSLPEDIGGQRNWDYRYCWLRDAYFVLSALNAIGHFEEIEGFMGFLMNVVGTSDLFQDGLSPVYSLRHKRPLPEETHENWHGFEGSRPVRSNNLAAEQLQFDVYGEMVLSLSPIFFDERFRHLRSRELQRLLENLVRLCARSIDRPDAGPWEIRSGLQPHSFSNLTCWAGLERASRMQRLGFLRDISLDIPAEMARAERSLKLAAEAGSLRNGPGDKSFDASLLLMPVFRYSDPILSEKTVEAIRENLQNPNAPSFLYRYTRNDDFGRPRSAFLVCSFWLVQALARLDRRKEGQLVLSQLLAAANSLGLFSEHFDPVKTAQRGNFPQAFSHVGLINAAFAVSPSWQEVL